MSGEIKMTVEWVRCPVCENKLVFSIATVINLQKRLFIIDLKLVKEDFDLCDLSAEFRRNTIFVAINCNESIFIDPTGFITKY